MRGRHPEPMSIRATLVKPETTRPFHVLAKPIGALCNLRCESCFHLDKSSLYPGSRFRMPDAVLETHARDCLASQPAGVGEINLAWQGGKPTLLGLDYFRCPVELQAHQALEGVTITNSLQTNGTRLDEQRRRFLSTGRRRVMAGTEKRKAVAVPSRRSNGDSISSSPRMSSSMC